MSDSVMQALDADYLVVGAGAMGMAFTDALVDHADVRVALVDRRTAPGGHWRDAYPFVQLHQASSFYGVASTVLGGGRIQQHGPEAGLHERATKAEICAYYDHVLTRLEATGRVTFLPGAEYAEGQVVTATGAVLQVPGRCRLVDARYREPSIPAHTPPPFDVEDGARVVPVNDLPLLGDRPSRYVLVGSGKTATDACIWLLAQRVDPDAICWVRPRDPWMLNRAVVQPDPAVFLDLGAQIMEAAATAVSLDALFLRLEAAGLMLRIDPTVTPTMARAPTLGTWELDRLRTVEQVVRLGHVRRVEPGRLVLTDGSVEVGHDTVVVHCAASGLQSPPLVPIWGEQAITLQTVRAGFPCFGAALTGYVEATRHDDVEKNRLCPPSPYGGTLVAWAAMQLLGTRTTRVFGAEPDIKAWADSVAVNPARVPPHRAADSAVVDAVGRLSRHAPAGLAGLAALSGLAPSPADR